MAFADIIDRDDASALMPEEVQKEIVQGTIESSAAMGLMTHQPMTRRQTRIPVLSVLPEAYFIDTANDIGLKQTTTQAWSNKYLNAEELAVIVPMPVNVLEDSEYDVWAQVKPRLTEAFGLKVDNAVFFGVSKPSTWPDDILTGATAAANSVVHGTSSIDVLDDINTVMGAVEADGFEVNGFWARIQMKSLLRGLRTNDGALIYQARNEGVGTTGGNVGTIWGEPVKFSKAGLTGYASASGNAELIAGDFKQAVLGIREDISMKVFDTGVITDDMGNIVYNLMQQDMVALRATMRVAFQVPNPINRQQPTESSRYPFGVLTQA